MNSLSFENLFVTDEKSIRTISLNRSSSLNSINYHVLDELEKVIEDSRINRDVNVIILKGEGRAFCAGDDINGMGNDQLPVPTHTLRRADFGYPRFIERLRGLEKPVIAQVHGYALGAGCDLALSCDLIYAEKSAKFGLVFSKRGMVAGTAILPQLVGYHKACEILFTGNMYTAEQWKQLGIINDVWDRKELEEKVFEVAENLAENSIGAIGYMKRGLNQSIGSSMHSSVEMQKHLMAISYNTHDFNEGKTAFVEKRQPIFNKNV
ncbi:enoyl-CoA hydratase/isomerase family protein [Pseudalkalibacillus sp. A8]|uniref:enoyl-CoA hydratase/isomerase family protein n=1 Tax=Pseudalkalibacillus sp. A8 TaxID=3382641 RepID=UPI0038B53C26